MNISGECARHYWFYSHNEHDKQQKNIRKGPCLDLFEKIQSAEKSVSKSSFRNRMVIFVTCLMSTNGECA